MKQRRRIFVTYDNLAKAFYLEFNAKATVARTVEKVPNVLVDLDENDKVVGVEIVRPAPGKKIFIKLSKQLKCPALQQVNPAKLEEAVPA